MHNTAAVDSSSIIGSEEAHPLPVLAPIILNSTDGSKKVYLFVNRIVGMQLKPEVDATGHVITINVIRPALPKSVLGPYQELLTDPEIPEFTTSVQVRLPPHVRVSPSSCEVVKLADQTMVDPSGRITPQLVGYALVRMEDPKSSSFKLPEISM